jgi:hypothetical protein
VGVGNRLSTYFQGVVVKRLSAVEADAARSHQHEINGIAAIRDVLGSEKRTFRAQFEYLADEEDKQAGATGSLTWYDARERHPSRSEWRLYIPDNTVYELAVEGDLLVIARRPDDQLLVIVARGGSTAENQLVVLFGYSEQVSGAFSVRDITLSDQDLDLAAKLLLELIGIELLDTEERLLEDMVGRWGGTFPRTTLFSAYARNSVSDIAVGDDPDAALLAWIEREEVLFRTLERHLVAERLESPISDVDEFIKYSLSIQNRRKSRAGHALENHLEHLFITLRISYSRGQITEHRARPDFLFPGIDNYRDPEFLSERLLMLGVKSTCKDRWRQVLSEARRIKRKHLMTLEPGISEHQTDEMRASFVQLVVPRGLHGTFSEGQRTWLMDLRGFFALVRWHAE